MNVDLRYWGRSGMTITGGSQQFRLSPNLAREPVAFDADLRQPLRFREAISALHDVVVSDLRFVPRDREAYRQWKEQQTLRTRQARREIYAELAEQVRSQQAVPADLEAKYRRARHRYWDLRSKFSRRLMTRHPVLWRLLTPCDPVITVANDVVFFECFSADQSSYGCLTTERDVAFAPGGALQPGTTNVDYSWQLYDHFQSLRSYRQTRLSVDPSGFEIATEGSPDYREEKIDLPEGWLRGFMQLQAAMTMPMRKVTLSRDALYSLVAWYKRHKPSRSPRAMRFELHPDQPPMVVLEPWEARVESTATRYTGPPGEPIRVWGARRITALARALPLVESCDVYLLGTGLPSFWVVHLGGMRLTLGLSGWTSNDWSGGASLELLAPPGEAKSQLVERAAQLLQREPAMRFDRLEAQLVANSADVAASLNHLARTGQVIYDLAAGVYRWRQVMPRAVGEADLGPPSIELVASRDLLQNAPLRIESQGTDSTGATITVGKVGSHPVELVVDRDGRIARGKCNCSHHHKGGLRRGPCRHLLALRAHVEGRGRSETSTADWYNRLRRWQDN